MQENETHTLNAPMAAAPMRYLEDGSVDWGNMWDSFCVLAQEGGPPHRAVTLQPGALPIVSREQYQLVAAEICRGIRLVSELEARPAESGWVAVQCHSDGMARWLSEAIVQENVAARAEGDLLYVPVGEAFTMKGEIKSVITAVAKTTHYWRLHLAAEVKQTLALQTGLENAWRRVRSLWQGHRRYRLPFLGILLLALLMAAQPQSAAAHPMGNFSVNRYSRLHLSAQTADLLYVVDLAEIPTVQELNQMDTNGDSVVDDDEGNAYLNDLLLELAQNLHLTIDERSVTLEPLASRVTFKPGGGGLETMRLEVDFYASLPDVTNPLTGKFRDDTYAGRAGWQEVVVQAGEGIELLDSSAPATDISDALRSYPYDTSKLPPPISWATFRFAPVGWVETAVETAPETAVETAIGTDTETAASLTTRLDMEKLPNLIESQTFGPIGLIVTLLIAVVLGAGHALSPGHGKTIVGAYLVGSRGTARHAIFLGLVTTVTHTAGVFVLGLLTLFASQYILPEQLFPWLSTLSGLLILLIGSSMVRSQLRQRDKSADEPGFHYHLGMGHSHLPEASQNGVRWRNLLALGVSGGLLPCPSALLLLLSAIALQRVGLGLLLVTAFSVGLAGVLTAVGLLLVYAGRLFERSPLPKGRLMRLLPVGSAAFITLLGLMMTFRSLLDIGLIP